MVHRNLEALLFDAWQAHYDGSTVAVLTHSEAVAEDCRERLRRWSDWAPNLVKAVDQAAGQQAEHVYVASSDLDAALATTPAETVALRRRLWRQVVNSATQALHVVRD